MEYFKQLQELFVKAKEMEDEEALSTEEASRQLSEEQITKMRKIQSQSTSLKLQETERAYTNYKAEKEVEETWRRYLSCSDLPDPSDLPKLNTFLYIWSLQNDEISMNEMAEKCNVVIYLLRKLDDIITNSRLSKNLLLEDYKTIRQQLREKLHNAIDMASYYLLRHIERDMVRVDLKNARHTMVSSELVCCTWARIRLPVGLKQLAEKDRKHIEVNFEDVDLSIKMPLDIDCYCMAIRILKLNYDRYSDQGRCFQMNDVSDFDFNQVDLMEPLAKALQVECGKEEINLRKCAVVGGIFHIDLVHQPTQEKRINDTISVTAVQLPKQLRRVPYSKPYTAPPPAPESERTPEVIEAEMKALEAAMEKLVLVTLKLPDSVLWFEPPAVAHWVDEDAAWSTENIHDVKFNEEKQQIAFRTGRLGVHGLVAYKFVNLPFQNWELKPETAKHKAAGGVLLSITGAIIQVDFIVQEDLVCLHSVAGASSTALQDLIDNYMGLSVLVQKPSQTILVTPEETTAIQCTEVSGEFCGKPVEETKNRFYADLYNLALDNAGVKTRLLIQDVSYKLAVTVAELLTATNILSMSS